MRAKDSSRRRYNCARVQGPGWMIVGNGRTNGHVTPCEQCPLRTLPCLRQFTAEELAFVKQFKIDELHVEAGASFLREGARAEHLYTVLSGWAFRYKMLDDGRRQILNFTLPADMVGLQGTLMHEMEHSVEALTPLTLCVFPRSKLYDLYGQFPSLALGGPNDANSRGTLIPTTSVAQYAATMAQWFGVPQGNLRGIFPTIGNFQTSNLGFLG